MIVLLVSDIQIYINISNIYSKFFEKNDTLEWMLRNTAYIYILKFWHILAIIQQRNIILYLGMVYDGSTICLGG